MSWDLNSQLMQHFKQGLRQTMRRECKEGYEFPAPTVVGEQLISKPFDMGARKKKKKKARLHSPRSAILTDAAYKAAMAEQSNFVPHGPDHPLTDAQYEAMFPGFVQVLQKLSSGEGKPGDKCVVDDGQGGAYVFAITTRLCGASSTEAAPPVKEGESHFGQ